MKALESLPTGFAPAEPWPAHPRVEVRAARSQDVLVPVGAGRSRLWALNPYSGCELACIGCPARDQVPFRDADPRLFERDIHVRANAAEAVMRALRDGTLANARLALGTTCDPWQPVEQKIQATRSVLDVLARWGTVDLRAQTRSTLAPRDAALLGAIGRKGRVSVTFSLSALDLKLARVLEPLAPSPDRRLIAMEALARAGIRVGVQVSPVCAGVNDDDRQIEDLLRRARGAGAAFASARPLAISEPARVRMVQFVARFNPSLAVRYDQILAGGTGTDPTFASELETRLGALCERLGLVHVPAPRPSRSLVAARSHEQRQLSLF